MLKLKEEAQSFESIIIEAIKNKYSTMMWDIHENEVIKVPVTIKNCNAYKKVLTLEIDHRAKEYIKDLISGIGYLKFYIPQSQMLFVSKIEFFRGSTLEISYPENFKTHDRRKENRLEPLIPVNFKVDGLKKECFDISAGGFSFILNGLEFNNSKLILDQVIECFIEFPFKKVKVRAKVVNIQNIKPFQVERFPYGAKRVSFKVELTDFYSESVEKLAKGMKKLLIDLL